MGSSRFLVRVTSCVIRYSNSHLNPPWETYFALPSFSSLQRQQEATGPLESIHRVGNLGDHGDHALLLPLPPSPLPDAADEGVPFVQGTALPIYPFC
jgi:hypothetical protein